MKKDELIRTSVLACGVLVMALSSAAVENLQISVRCPNVVLAWPSVEGETYIVQYRPTLDTNAAWVTLTNGLPAAAGTNWTWFVHSNHKVCVTNGDSGGGGSGANPPSPMDAELEARSEAKGVAFPISEATRQYLAKRHIYPPYAWDLERRPPHIWELEARPPYPWEPGASGRTRSAPRAASLTGAIAESEGPLDSGAETNVVMGFYRVVRVGIRLCGVTNGMVLSGRVTLCLEYGNLNTNNPFAALFLVDTNSDVEIRGVSLPDLSGGKTALTGVWDTMQVTNGSYAIQMGAYLDDMGIAYMDTPVQVTISNLLWFPDSWNIGGYGLYIGAQTPYTDGAGSYELRIYDDTDQYVGNLSGPIDSNGWLTYPGYSGPYTIDNSDSAGNLNPSSYYTLVFEGDTNHPLASSPPWTITNRVLVEYPWNFQPTRATVVYMDIFGNGRPDAQNTALEMMRVVAETEAGFHPLSTGVGTPLDPHLVPLNGDWTYVLTMGIGDWYSRDFVYFGHGSPTALGTTQHLLTTRDVSRVLTNDWTTQPPQHPYRFVFLDGCNTAEGHWPEVFGIPKRKGMTSSDFVYKRGVRPRAFMGWNREKQIGWMRQGMFNYDHLEYITRFWQRWASVDPATGTMRTLKQARQYAEIRSNGTPNPQAKGMVVYGAEDLTIDR